MASSQANRLAQLNRHLRSGIRRPVSAERTADASAGGHLLVVGATGIIGRAVIEHFAHRPNWTVTAMSRREPDFELGGAEWIRLDLDDRSGTEEALQEAQQGDREPVTHAIFGAVYEQPGGLIDSWASAEMIDRNDAMFRAFLDAATLHSPAMRHLTVMQGGKAYGVPGGNVLNPQLPPYKERRPRVHDGGFYWRQEDYMLEVQGKGAPWTYTIWRPPIVCGFAYNSPLNVMAAIGAHAAVLRELGQPLEYPGASPGQLNEVVDSRLIASAMEWAAENCGEGGAAANQTFNITNGDTAAWEGIYPTIAAHFGMEMGEPAEDWSRDYLAKWAQVPEHAAAWERVVEKHGLKPYTLDEFVNQSWDLCDMLLGGPNRKSGGSSSRPDDPYLRASALSGYGQMSTIKLRQAGFAECVDTEDMTIRWLEEMQGWGVLPK